MTDLKLVPLEDMKREIFDRCEQCVIIMKRSEDNKEPVVRCSSKTGSVDGVGMCEVAKEFFVRLTLGDCDAVE